MQEERARQEAAAKKAAEDPSGKEKGDAGASSSADAVMAEADGKCASVISNCEKSK